MSEDGEHKVAMRQQAYAALEHAIELFNAYDGQEAGYVTVDAILVVGAQKIDDEGDRVGSIGWYPRNGAQPPYVSAGLLDEARTHLHKVMTGDE